MVKLHNANTLQMAFQLSGIPPNPIAIPTRPVAPEPVNDRDLDVLVRRSKLSDCLIITNSAIRKRDMFNTRKKARRQLSSPIPRLLAMN